MSAVRKPAAKTPGRHAPHARTILAAAAILAGATSASSGCGGPPPPPQVVWIELTADQAQVMVPLPFEIVLEWAHDAGEVRHAEATIRGPDGVERTLQIANEPIFEGTRGQAILQTSFAADAPGTYELEVMLFDAWGSASRPALAVLEAVAFRIESADPDRLLVLPDDKLAVIATLTAPLGASPIAAGTLVDGARQLSVFSRLAEGVYLASAFWVDLVDPSMVSALGENLSLDLNAVFTDEAGYKVDRAVEVSVGCGVGRALCAGRQCVAATDRFNCGSCGWECPLWAGSCTEGVCCPIVPNASSSERRTCADLCAAATENGKAMMCSSACAGQAGRAHYIDGIFTLDTGIAACGDTPPEKQLSGPQELSFDRLECYCVPRF
jgi:hypothetical protein